MLLGELIHQYRKEKKLSVYELAKAAGVSHSYISQLEQSKKNNPDDNILARISLALNIPLGKVLLTKANSLEEIIKSIQSADTDVLYEHDSIRKKIFSLTPEELLNVEGYVDYILQNRNKKK